DHEATVRKSPGPICHSEPSLSATTPSARLMAAMDRGTGRPSCRAVVGRRQGGRPAFRRSLSASSCAGGPLGPGEVAAPVGGLDAPAVRAQLAAQLLDVDVDRPLLDQLADAALDQLGAAEDAAWLAGEGSQQAVLRPGEEHLAPPDTDGVAGEEDQGV